MANPQEIPQLVTELYDMSREYLRQETIEPAKQLGKQAGMGIGGAMVMATGVFLLVLGLYAGLIMWLPEGEWWVVLARFITALAAVAGAGIVGWRIQVSLEAQGGSTEVVV
jgi:hypothetical protein